MINTYNNEIKGVEIIILTLIVMLVPPISQLFGTNLIKLVEDFMYLLTILLSFRLIVKKRVAFKIPLFLGIFILSFFVFIMVGIYYNGIAMVVLQIRELKYLFLLLILLPYIECRQFDKVWLILKIIAFLSVPIAVLQWMNANGDGDLISGLMGYGGSGTLSLFLLIVFFTEFTLRLQSSKRLLGFYFILLFPTMINETKISIVLYPLMLIIAFWLTKKLNLKNVIMIGIIIMLLLTAWATMYKYTYKKSFSQIVSQKYISSYMYNTNWDTDMGRIDKIKYAYQIIKDDNLFFGYGLGSSYYGKSSGIEGYIYDMHSRKKLFSGTRPQLFVSLIEEGAVGVLIIIGVILSILIKLLSADFSINKCISIFSIIVILISLVYQHIFYTYQIMYIFIFYTFLCYRYDISKAKLRA